MITSGVALSLRPDDGKVGRKWLTWELCCAKEPESTKHAPAWVKIGQLADDILPISRMTEFSWYKKSSSMAVLANILEKSHDINFRDEIV